MSEIWEGKGECPFCKTKDDFRELTLGENLKGVLFWGLSHVSTSKLKAISKAASDFSGTGYFPNFICNSCKGKVHQCGGCKTMLPYKDGGSCEKCNYN